MPSASPSKVPSASPSSSPTDAPTGSPTKEVSLYFFSYIPCCYPLTSYHSYYITANIFSNCLANGCSYRVCKSRNSCFSFEQCNWCNLRDQLPVSRQQEAWKGSWCHLVCSSQYSWSLYCIWWCHFCSRDLGLWGRRIDCRLGKCMFGNCRGNWPIEWIAYCCYQKCPSSIPISYALSQVCMNDLDNSIQRSPKTNKLIMDRECLWKNPVLLVWNKVLVGLYYQDQ